MNRKRIITILIAGLLLAGIFVKCYYVSYTDTWVRQHDVIGFGADEGHAAYIEYIRNEKKLPDFDLREKWAFFQPPLHHIISASVMDLASNFTDNSKKIEESTQIPTCIYMILMTFLALYIFLKAKGMLKLSYQNTAGKFYTEGCVVMLGIVALHPMFTLFSGSINNDTLPLFLEVLALVAAAAWYEKPTYVRTVLVALLIGLAMFSKLTGGLVAVPIGIIMLRKFFGYSDGESSSGSGRKMSVKERFGYFFKTYIIKAIVFALVVFPVGLFWSIRSKLMWDIPVNYIPEVGEHFPESVTLVNRIADIGTKSPYTYMVNKGFAYDEYNVPLSIIKTSLFSEFEFPPSGKLTLVAWVLFATAVILALLSLVAVAAVTFGKKYNVSRKWKILLFGSWATYLAAYLYFALSNNNFSACDFRYSGICIVCSGIFLGIYTDGLKNKKLKYMIAGTAVVFAACSFAAYVLLGIKS